MEWPTDKVFYLVAAEGLFLCRNHPFFKSCVKINGGPKELESQKETVTLKYPKIPQALLERAVGFFRLVADKQNSEAAAIWIWNQSTQQVELVVPEQKAINSSSSSTSPHGYPMDVKYEMPMLPPHQVYMGDIHCHVDGSAYASATDTNDEVHRPGIHIVVGHIDAPIPQFYCDAVVDGQRFKVDNLSTVWEGFSEPDTDSVPPEWVERVKLEKAKPFTSTYSYHDSTGYGSYGSYGSYGGYTGYTGEITPELKKRDRETIRRVLSEFLLRDQCPTMTEVRQELFRRTQNATYLSCEKKAERFVKHWHKAKANYEKSKQFA